ncbi:MAG: tetratricopeptide repeat protein, partial [Gemmataceae bacterium]|nr:tetratricopeptide repeat protein [Gemmataceae bacterium]
TTAAVLISLAYGRSVVAPQQAETDFDIALHSLQTLAETVQKQMGTQPGLLPVKRKLLETAADGLNKVMHGPTSAERADKTVVIAHTNLGDVYRDLGRTADAQREFESAQRRSLDWLRRQPLDADALRGAANACNRLGDLANAAKDATAALGYYKQARDNFLQAMALDPADMSHIRDISVCHNKIGDAELTAKNYPAARACYEHSLALREQPDTSNDELTRLSDLRFTHNRLTDVCLLLMDLDAAERHATAAVDSGRAIAKLDVNAGRFQTANALDRLGGVMIRKFEPAQAERFRGESVALRREIAAADTGSALAKRQLATAISQWADALAVAGRFDEAIAGHAESIGIFTDLFANDPESVELAINLAIAYERIRDNCNFVGRFSDAAEWSGRAVELFGRLEPESRFTRLQPKEMRQLHRTALDVFRYAAKHDLAVEGDFAGPNDVARGMLKRVRILECARRGRTEMVLKLAGEMNTTKDSYDAMIAARACAIVGELEAMLKYWREAVRIEPAIAPDIAIYHEFYRFRDRPEFQALMPGVRIPRNPHSK